MQENIVINDITIQLAGNACSTCFHQKKTLIGNSRRANVRYRNVCARKYQVIVG